MHKNGHIWIAEQSDINYIISNNHRLLQLGTVSNYGLLLVCISSTRVSPCDNFYYMDRSLFFENQDLLSQGRVFYAFENKRIGDTISYSKVVDIAEEHSNDDHHEIHREHSVGNGVQTPSSHRNHRVYAG